MDNKRHKMNIILDLDNTIICSLSPDQIKDITKSEKEYLKTLQYKSMKTGKYLDFRVYYRPHLKEFLLFLFQNFNCAVFTAADMAYGVFIVNEIIYKCVPQELRKLDFILHNDHTTISEKKYNGVPKKLKMLWDDYKIPGYNKNNTILLDDLDDTFYGNTKGLVLRVKPFECLNEKGDDNFLLFLIERLKRELKNRLDHGII